ncbi:MAG TPA: protein kinase [Kofleriaceae bacterium]|nr:protein kinase [Kofleriaceae bacterium]
MEPEDGTLIGEEVGGYVVESELGRGGMGVVYAATHPMIGKRVAIKVIKHSLSNSPATVERFVQEARSVNQIGHPNIVDIFAFGALPDGRSYLIMDLLVGESLRKRVKRGALPVEDTVRILDEVASALAAAHDKGFIHRDLKPDNVYLVDHHGKVDVKLLDFGLAKLLAPAGMSGRAFRTATGAMLGTPDYMSPEQLKGTGVDHRTDIYALGVVAFEVIAGERPRRYSDGSFELEGLTVPRFLAEGHGAPLALAELIDAMLSPNADQRPSLTAIRAVLKRVKSGQSEPVRAIGTAPSLETFEARTTPQGRSLPAENISPSMVGARPVVATPLSGTPTIEQVPSRPAMRPPTQPPASRQPQASQQPQYAARPPTQPPLSQQPQYGSRPPTQPPVSQQPQYASQQPQYASQQAQYGGLAKVSSHPATKLGVAPPPERPSMPHPVAAARRGTGNLWLFLGLGLVIVSAIALVAVLAS